MTERLRETLDLPANRLARAVGKAHYGSARTAHYFDDEGWAFLLETVASVRAALEPDRAPEDGLDGIRRMVREPLPWDGHQQKLALRAMREALAAAPSEPERPALDAATLQKAVAKYGLNIDLLMAATFAAEYDRLIRATPAPEEAGK